ncbi:Protein of unknown function [Pyronema omphalodes CBS 100304]|uniref:Uncharacterized protein n=1 Tax=Pyronema omphalodes (strain CBS 100304) TaxID=1076935 RepID=U4L6K0_PYROM|nr:Protein of unknown function [Pyronema omphalodes CBS 100304]
MQLPCAMTSLCDARNDNPACPFIAPGSQPLAMVRE